MIFQEYLNQRLIMLIMSSSIVNDIIHLSVSGRFFGSGGVDWFGDPAESLTQHVAAPSGAERTM